MNDPYNLSNSRSSMSIFFFYIKGQGLDLAGKYSYLDDSRHHRYKHF